MKCSKCQSALPEGMQVRFCPFCGTAVRAPSSVTSTEPYAKEAPDKRTPTRDVVVGEAPAGLDALHDTMIEPDLKSRIEEAAKRESAQRPARRPASRTPVVNRPPEVGKPAAQQADTPEPAVAPKPAGRRAPTRPATEPPAETPHRPVVRAKGGEQYEAPTRMEMPAVSERDLAAQQNTVDELPPARERKTPVIRARSTAAAAAKEQLAQTGQRSEAGPEGDDPKRFSETAWFLAAVNPENLSEGEATDFVKQEEMTERYEVPGRLPDDVRKSFSLTKQHKTIDADESGKKKK